MTTTIAFPPSLARRLVLEELFDLQLYKSLAPLAGPELRPLLVQLVAVEQGHLKFWQEFFHLPLNDLSVGQKLKLAVLLSAARLFGDRAIHLILESIEVYGVKKYLEVWDHYRDTPLGDATKKILQDELEHEDKIIAASLERRISGESIRNIFLGFNDGLVEILGAVSGFFAAFAHSGSVLVAALTVAVAGAISMASGVYVSSGSEKEVDEMERRRQLFIGEQAHEEGVAPSAMPGAIIVGVSYLLGSLVPILPVLFGAQNVVISVVVSFVMIALVSLVLSFLSGMDIRRRIGINIVVIATAVVVTSIIGTIAREYLGVPL